MDVAISLEDVSYTYQAGTPFEYEALHSVSLSISKGEIAGMIGPTGSGKSTLVQHFNGLLIPSRGKVKVMGRDINLRDRNKSNPVCFEVGLVFQYPEYQLFEETVFEDVAFGPRNMGLSPAQVQGRVEEALEWMGLNLADYGKRSPFSLSGGEMRRVALAGVLAMRPKVLVLDEPVAGLDPRGCRELMDRICSFRDQGGVTLVLVSHEMGQVARLADHLIIIEGGRIVGDGSPNEIFQRTEWIRGLGLGLPPYMDLMEKLTRRGYDVKPDVLTDDEAAEEIKSLLSRQN